VGYDLARLVKPCSGDVSTEGFGPLCWVLWNPDEVRLGSARSAQAQSGSVEWGMARQPLQTAARGASAPTAALFGE